MFVKKNIKFLLAFFLFIALIIPTQTIHAKTSEIKGIDVSGKFNGIVDWNAVAEQGYTFAMIQIAVGQAPDVDSQFEANYLGAKAAGLKVGVYHYCCVHTPEDAVLEANYCLELLNGRELDYPVAYDIEQDGEDGKSKSFSGGIENTTALAKSYCDIISAAGYTPMIYSTANHLNNDFNWDELDGIKIWVAHYGVDETTFSRNYDLWQFTNKGSVEGANNDQGNCDINYSFLEATDISMGTDDITLGIKESYQLEPLLTPTDCTDTISFVSSDDSIATVDENGFITAQSKGSAVITGTTGSGMTADLTITVKKAPKSIRLSIHSKKLSKGKTYQLKPILSSGYASNKITYISNNKQIAYVSKNGKIKAKRAGTATITITTYNGKTTTVKIIVR
ncbi:MAG: GH25 family lysozyme [Velocimicrobium sp.]